MKSLHRNQTDFCGPGQIYDDNLPFELSWIVQACFRVLSLPIKYCLTYLSFLFLRQAFFFRLDKRSFFHFIVIFTHNTWNNLFAVCVTATKLACSFTEHLRILSALCYTTSFFPLLLPIWQERGSVLAVTTAWYSLAVNHQSQAVACNQSCLQRRFACLLLSSV